MPRKDSKNKRDFVVRNDRFQQIVCSHLRDTYRVRGPVDGRPNDELKVVLVPAVPEDGLPTYLLYEPALPEDPTLDDIIAARRKCRAKAKLFRFKLQGLEAGFNDPAPLDV